MKVRLTNYGKLIITVNCSWLQLKLTKPIKLTKTRHFIHNIIIIFRFYWLADKLLALPVGAKSAHVWWLRSTVEWLAYLLLNPNAFDFWQFHFSIEI